MRTAIRRKREPDMGGIEEADDWEEHAEDLAPEVIAQSEGAAAAADMRRSLG